MARQPRLVFAGHALHVVHRGVNRGACFAEDGDRTFYLGLLQEHLPKSACSLHAYVLMTNHVHLLLTPDDDHAAAGLMKAVAQKYAQRCNKRWKRTGPFWETPFKSSLIDSHTYALNCHRYIEENPLRAGMVRHPFEYPWSSFRANAMGHPSPLLTQHRSVESLGGDPVERRIAYRALFDTPQAEKEVEVFREALKSSLAAGSPEFIEHVAIASGRRATRRNRWTAAA
jgi:putative transposase